MWPAAIRKAFLALALLGLVLTAGWTWHTAHLRHAPPNGVDPHIPTPDLFGQRVLGRARTVEEMRLPISHWLKNQRKPTSGHHP